MSNKTAADPLVKPTIDAPNSLAPLSDAPPPLIFKRGRAYPKAIAWFGFRSFWGHLRHLAASAIATEDIDARDWMTAQSAAEMTGRVAKVLSAASGSRASQGPVRDDRAVRQHAASLGEALERDVWIDFVADTGDDADVSEAVAKMLFREHRAGDQVLPRGDVLLFGGDTAYPVATEMEIHNRVCVPFNRVLKETDDGRARVIMGIPGNHDWYDGLDGFARLFQARRGAVDRMSELDQDDVQRGGQIGHLVDWVEAFRVGSFVTKRPALPLTGYVPVQNASYFALDLAPKLTLYGVDRQLRALDYAQSAFFLRHRSENADHGVVMAVSDPVMAMLEHNPKGADVVERLAFDLEQDAPLILTGDTHHYCRHPVGKATHVIAGGGGAFLHPTRIWRRKGFKVDAEFPNREASFRLAMQVPWQIAAGRAGFMVHVVVGLLYMPIVGLQFVGVSASRGGSLVATIVVTIACALLCGWRRERGFLILLLAGICGVWVGVLPYLAEMVLNHLLIDRAAGTARALLGYVLTIYPAALGFGTYLMVITLLGLEQHQAFSALAHPGYKHFLRMRVRKDGSGIDTWAIGKVNTLDPDEPISLIDKFRWDNPLFKAPSDASPAEVAPAPPKNPPKTGGDPETRSPTNRTAKPELA